MSVFFNSGRTRSTSTGRNVTRQLFVCVLLIVAFCCTTGFGQSRRVVLITIDGFRPDFYMDPSWGAFNLQQMMKAGACAKNVKGIFPTVTFPSHTTLVTGVRPAEHGIYYNTPFEPAGQTGDWYWHYKAIQSPTLWEAVRKAGRTTGSVLWPVTAGAPIDYNIPDIWEAGKLDRREITRRYATPPGFWEEMETNATGRLEANDFNLDKDYLSMDENVARMAGYIIRKYKPAFTTIHLAAVDHAEHHDGRDGEQVRRAVTGADRSVRTIVEAIDKAGLSDSTVIIITGDHGFAERRQEFCPNVLLQKAGLMNDIANGDWKAQFLSAGGSAFLYLKDKKDTKTLAQVRKLLADLPDAQKKLFRVIDSDKLKHSGIDPDVSLALSAFPDAAFSGTSKGELLRPSRGGTHGHFPDFDAIYTGFIASGPGVRSNVIIEELNMVDIAPIIAKILGVRFTGDAASYDKIMSR